MFHQLPSYAGTAALPAAQPPPAPLPSVPRLDLSRVPPSQHTAAFEYDSFLSRLTFNSKDLITTLTRVAGENLHNADGIAAVLEQRVLTAPPTVKLPMLYLLDSIVKNIGGPYVNVFRANLFHTFATAYANTTPQVRVSMHRLLNTWPPVFGIEVVTAMRRRAADIDATSQSQPPPPIPPQGYQGLQIPRGLTMPQGLQMPPPPPPPPPSHSQPHAQPSIPGYPLKLRSGPPLAHSMPSQTMIPPARNAPPPAALPAAALRSGLRSSTQPSTEGTFLQVQSLMQEISRKASLGVAPSNHQLFTINRLISTLLPTSHPPERDALLSFQSQLREMPTRSASNPPSFPPTTPSTAYPPQPPVSDALSSLLRNPPPGLLVSPKPQVSSAPLRDVRIPRHSVPPPPRTQLPPQPDIPKVLRFADIKTLSHAAAVRSLYADLPHLSKSDGMRFATKEQLREHLDWLFQKNRSKRARERGLTVGGSSRCWFDSISKILEGKSDKETDQEPPVGTSTVGTDSTVDQKDDGMSNAIVAIAASEKCEACQEEIESFWSDDHQAWMLKDAIRTEDGEVYHRTCVESASTPKHDDSNSTASLGITGAKVKDEVSSQIVDAKNEISAVKAEDKPLVAEAVPGANAVAEEILSRKRTRDSDQEPVATPGSEFTSSKDSSSPIKRAKIEGSVV